MTRKFCCSLLVVLLLCAGHALAQVTQPVAQPVTAPDTPAGRTLRTWLEAFNSGDRAKLEAYVKNVDHSESVDGMIGFHSQSGGFDLVSIISSEPLHIRFTVKEKAGPTHAVGSIAVKDGHPPTIDTFNLGAFPPGSVIENVTIDAAMRKRVIDGVISNLNEYYVEPTVAQQMAEALRAHDAKNDYASITDGDVLADRISKDLDAVSHDKHLHVRFAPYKQPADPKPSPEDDARWHQQMLHDNCAFTKVEILPNNIGYISFNGFMDASVCGPTVVAAMAFVAHTDALIFDLRQNGGGQPAMVTMIASYLFDEPTHLIDIYNRKEDKTTQNWTLSFLPGTRLPKIPVYVLTSKRTFSGAEEFAFDLKNQKRATIIGETTGGGAHPVSGHPVADYFEISVPFAKSLDPITKTNWEGTGVTPDVAVPADDALTTGEKLAFEKIQTLKSAR